MLCYAALTRWLAVAVGWYGSISGKKETNACYATALKVVHDTGYIEMLL
jgi:hypothetical protein